VIKSFVKFVESVIATIKVFIFRSLSENQKIEISRRRFITFRPCQKMHLQFNFAELEEELIAEHYILCEMKDLVDDHPGDSMATLQSVIDQLPAYKTVVADFVATTAQFEREGISSLSFGKHMADSFVAMTRETVRLIELFSHGRTKCIFVKHYYIVMASMTLKQCRALSICRIFSTLAEKCLEFETANNNEMIKPFLQEWRTRFEYVVSVMKMKNKKMQKDIIEAEMDLLRSIENAK
jgi:hypothetical protein